MHDRRSAGVESSARSSLLTANGRGTDHGTAAPHFLVGSRVKGGRYGAAPSLTQLDAHGNPAPTTDFRVLYATALQEWLGVEAEPVVGRGFAPLPVVA